MKNYSFEPISRLLKWILLAGALSYVVLYLFVALSRIRYPFELIWLEGAYVDHVNRILSGYKYYVEPSIEFVPSIYTPLYFYLSALLSKAIGIGFFPLRLISFFSSLGSFIIIYLMVKKETGDYYSGLLASALFSATFYLTAAHFDIGRVDSLFLFLLLSSIYILRFKETQLGYILAGILISLAFMTKQTALVISIPIMIYCIFLNRRISFYFILPIIMIVGLGNLILNYYFDGWFNFYVFELPRTTPTDKKIIFSFWLKDIIIPLGIAFFMGIIYMLLQLMNENKKAFFFYLFVAAGALVASWYSRFRIGDTNVLFPTYAVIAILFGLGLNKMIEFSHSLHGDSRGLIKIFIYLMCLAQFSSGSLVYNPFEQIPSKKDLEAGKELVKRISQIEGDVFIPNHGYLTIMAGKRSYANVMGMRDIMFTKSAKHAAIQRKFIEEVKQAMKEKKFGAVILDSVETCAAPGATLYYVFKEKLFNDNDVFIPVTGTKTRPDLLYLPKE